MRPGNRIRVPGRTAAAQDRTRAWQALSARTGRTRRHRETRTVINGQAGAAASGYGGDAASVLAPQLRLGMGNQTRRLSGQHARHAVACGRVSHQERRPAGGPATAAPPGTMIRSGQSAWAAPGEPPGLAAPGVRPAGRGLLADAACPAGRPRLPAARRIPVTSWLAGRA